MSKDHVHIVLKLDRCLLLELLHARVKFDLFFVNVLLKTPLVIVSEVCASQSFVLCLLLLNIVFCLLHPEQEPT